ncbi:hypothetical protein TMatcc_001316 [Talaromyces marneffei ATCC 18224]
MTFCTEQRRRLALILKYFYWYLDWIGFGLRIRDAINRLCTLILPKVLRPPGATANPSMAAIINTPTERVANYH